MTIKKVLFLDCQTTSSKPESGGILEIGWALSQSSIPFYQHLRAELIQQDEDIPPRITRITGISASSMEDAKPLKTLGLELKKLIEQEKPTAAVIHYAQFEQPFLHDLFHQTGQTDFPLDIICTNQIAKRLYPDLPSRGIRALAGYLAMDAGEMKRTTDHVKATAVIWHHLYKQLQAEKIESLSDIQSWLKNKKIPKRQTRDYPLAKEKRLNISKAPGIYRMVRSDGTILYIGKAKSLHSRVNSYFRGQKKRNQKHMEMLTQTIDIQVTETATALEAALLETDEIKKIDPPYNISLKAANRTPVFLNRQLDETYHTPNDNFCYGPIVNQQNIMVLHAIEKFFDANQLQEDLLYDQPEEDITRHGLKLFLETHFSENDKPTLRQLTALGMGVVRAELKREDEEAGEESDEDSDEDEEQIIEWTPELVSYTLIRSCRRFAKQLIRAKELRALANCQIYWKKKTAGWRHIEFLGGEIKSRGHLSSVKKANSSKKIKNVNLSQIDIETYDRLRVLYTELLRLITEERKLKIFYADAPPEVYP